MTGTIAFDILHVLRLKGIATDDALTARFGSDLEAAQAEMQRLADDGLIVRRETPRLSGWSLTAEGRTRHATEMAEARTPETETAIAPHYEGFLALNNRVKALATSWQQLAPDDAAGRWEAIEELGDIHAEATRIVDAVSATLPRFAWHERRLAVAMERLRDGDERYFTGVTVDSFHTVWFECHEDLIQTLGRERVAEGSF